MASSLALPLSAWDGGRMFLPTLLGAPANSRCGVLRVRPTSALLRHEIRLQACRTLRDILADPDIDAFVCATPSDVHRLSDTPPQQPASTSFSTSRLPTPLPAGARRNRPVPQRRRRALASALSVGAKTISAGSGKQIDAGLFGRIVNAEANISRRRLAAIDLSSWRYQAARHARRRDASASTLSTCWCISGGPIEAVRGQAALLVLQGD